MKKYWKILPAAALVLLYGISINFRPLLDWEIAIAALAGFQQEHGLGNVPVWLASVSPGGDFVAAFFGRIAGSSPWALRLLAVLPLLVLLVVPLWRDRGNGVARSLIFGTMPLVFWQGSSLGTVPLAALAALAAIHADRLTNAPARWAAGIAASAAAVLVGGWGMPVVLVFAFVLIGRMRLRRLDLLCGALPGAAVLWHFQTALPPVGVTGINFALLLLGTMPWMLLLPVYTAAWKRMDDRPGTALRMMLLCFIAGLILPSAFPLLAFIGCFYGAEVAGALLAAVLNDAALAERFNRILRTLAVLLITLMVALAAVHAASRFMKIDPALLLYVKNNQWITAIFALCVPLLWWHLARQERDAQVKIVAFGSGTAFLLLGISLMLPLHVLLPHAPLETFRRYVLPRLGNGVTVVAEEKFMAPLYWLTRRVDLQLAPEDPVELGKLLRQKMPNVICMLGALPDVESSRLLPPSRNRFWYKPAKLFIMEYKKQ